MSVLDVAGGRGSARLSVAPRGERLPHPLDRCQRVVAVTVALPELLLAAAGALQRLDMAGVVTEVLELAWTDRGTDRAAVAALSRLQLTNTHRHRLALPMPFGIERVDDVVAAMSELVGFDPEPGLVCLVPGGDAGQDRPAHQALHTATARIRAAYRLRTLSYGSVLDERTAEVELTDAEWRRKCGSVEACAPDVATLSGRRELFTG